MYTPLAHINLPLQLSCKLSFSVRRLCAVWRTLANLSAYWTLKACLTDYAIHFVQTDNSDVPKPIIYVTYNDPSDEKVKGVWKKKKNEVFCKPFEFCHTASIRSGRVRHYMLWNSDCAVATNSFHTNSRIANFISHWNTTKGRWKLHNVELDTL